MLCAERGDLNGILKLISNGLNIQQCRGLNGFTPLHHACNRGHANVVAELIKMRIPINCVNDNGEVTMNVLPNYSVINIIEYFMK